LIIWEFDFRPGSFKDGIIVRGVVAWLLFNISKFILVPKDCLDDSKLIGILKEEVDEESSSEIFPSELNSFNLIDSKE
jgi:hypothetical protein